jgi:hypothetical protein
MGTMVGGKNPIASSLINSYLFAFISLYNGRIVYAYILTNIKLNGK